MNSMEPRRAQWIAAGLAGVVLILTGWMLASGPKGRSDRADTEAPSEAKGRLVEATPSIPGRGPSGESAQPVGLSVAAAIQTPAPAASAPEGGSFDDMPIASLAPLSLTGTVTDAGGVPLKEARVVVRDVLAPPEDSWSTETLTDSAGHYAVRISPLPLGRISVEVDGFEWGEAVFGLDEAELTSTASGAVFELRRDFRLLPGGASIAGRVIVASTREPVVGARVIFLQLSRRAFHDTWTDMDGRFRFDGLPVDEGSLLATADGYAAASLPGQTPGGNSIEIALQSGGTRIHGTVIGSRTQRPAPRTRIVALSVSQDVGLMGLHWADDAGRYATYPLAAGQYRLSAGGELCAEGPDEAITIPESGPEEIELNLRVDEPIEVRGWVRERGTERPIADARVQQSSSVGLSDSQGRFRFLACAPDAAKTFSLAAKAKGYADARATVSVLSGSSEMPEPVVIHMAVDKKAGQFTGLVREIDGQPVAGVVVRLRPDKARGGQTTTGPEGEFEIPVTVGIRDEKVTVVLSTPDRGGRFDEFTWPADSASLRKEYTLEAGEDFRVIVYDRDRKGAPGLTVSLYARITESSGTQYCEGITDANGTVVFSNLPAKKYNVYVVRNDETLLSKSEAVDLADAESPRTLELYLEDGVRTMRGHVSDEGGKPLEGVRVKAGSGARIRSTTTDAQGEYVLEMIGEAYGAHYVFEKEGYQNATPSVQFGRESREAVVDVTMIVEGRIWGRVTNADGQPIQGLVDLVVLYKKNEGSGEAVGQFGRNSERTALNAEGEFDLPLKQFLSHSSYAVRISDPAFGSGRSAWGLGDGAHRVGPLDVRLGWNVLRGRVIDAETGNPVSGAVVTLQILNYSTFDARYNDYASMMGGGGFPKPAALSDAGGNYELAPAPAGAGDVYVMHPDYGIQRFPYTIDGADASVRPDTEAPADPEESREVGAFHDLPLALRVEWRGRLLFAGALGGSSWSIRIAQTPDSGIPGELSVTSSGKWVSGDGGGEANAAGGGFRLASLAPGATEVNVGVSSRSTNSYATYTWPVTIPFTAKWTEDLRLPPLARVEAVVPAAENQVYEIGPFPENGLRVVFGFSRTTQNPVEQTIQFYLPPGSYRVREFREPRRRLPPDATPLPPPREGEIVVSPEGGSSVRLP